MAACRRPPALPGCRGPARRLAGAAAVALVLAAASGCQRGPDRDDRAGGGTVVLRVHDESGRRLSWRQFRDVQSNGAGEDGYNDALLDPSTLRVTEVGPLYPSDGGVAVDRPGGPSVLALAWPSSDGYSQLLLPLPPAGTYDFNLLAARQAVLALHDLTAAHPDTPPAFDAAVAVARATAQLANADAATDEAAAAAAASSAYDAAVHAQVLLLQQYGAPRAPSVRRAVTLDDVPGDAQLRQALSVVGTGGWVRMVLDPGTPFARYAGPVAAAHRLGLRVLALPVDSSEMARLDDRAWRSRITAAVAALPTVDEWEAGNEVNGDWLGERVAARVAWAVDHVHQHSGARVLVTVYWQLGEGDRRNALFNWLADHPEAVARADDVGLSLYPEEHPLGAATGAVLDRLHAVLPGKPLLISELGYRAPDLEPIWWWGSETDPSGAGRAAVATMYTLGPAGYPFTDGGPFWWYFTEDTASGTPLVSALDAAWR